MGMNGWESPGAGAGGSPIWDDASGGEAGIMIEQHTLFTRPMKGLETALQIVEYLGGWVNPPAIPRPRAASLTVIATDLGIPEPSIYRLLQTLRRAGWLEEIGREYRLGLKVGLLGVGIHTALRHQAESLAGAISRLDAVVDQAGAVSQVKG